MRSMVKGYVAKAFNMIGDLAENVVLSSSSASGFNYTTGEAVASTPITHNLKAVVEFVKKKDSNTLIAKLLVMAKEVELISDLDAFDKVTIRGIVYRVIAPSLNDGYTVTISATKETV